MPPSHAPGTASFRADAVKLVEHSGTSARQVAVELGIATESLRRWVQQAKTDTGHGPPGALTTEEREELRRLRRENWTLVTERQILNKAAAFFAKETLQPRCGSSTRRRPAIPSLFSPGSWASRGPASTPGRTVARRDGPRRMRR